mgnify:FL=1
MEPPWCRVCGTRHGRDAVCPGPLLATGPERSGFRIAVETPDGIEAIGVLVAPAGRVWRARVLTYPNVLWTVPGGDGSLKFVGASPAEAERKAIEYVRAHCARRGWLRRDEVVAVGRGDFPAESVRGPRAPGAPAERKVRALPVRYGTEAPTAGALTANVSETGLFVATIEPFVPGTEVRLRVEFDEDTNVPVLGRVVWNREKMEIGRPSGMGIRLLALSTAYVRAVRALS